MLQDQGASNGDKIKELKVVYGKALDDIRKIEQERDEKIKELLKTIDNRHINKILEDIKNINS